MLIGVAHGVLLILCGHEVALGRVNGVEGPHTHVPGAIAESSRAHCKTPRGYQRQKQGDISLEELFLSEASSYSGAIGVYVAAGLCKNGS